MKRGLFVLIFLACMTGILRAEKRTVYMSFILHGNMNYDRYVRPTIWKEFPKIYDGLLDYMDEHPDFKGQLQFSGQTLGSMLQTAPEVVNHALAIHRRGQLNFTGTFYSEPVNVNMNGETNYRCAWLGTKIVEKFLGEKTDGFYLQERAYHPQLPWILSHSDVSWTPIITNDESWYPFQLKGMDGTASVCVPITRENVIENAQKAPRNSLIAIEEDYEIPQCFTDIYETVARFNKENDSIQVEWITVKDYINRFGIKQEKYIDHSAKAKNRDNGTYSRWTADPLDIITQNYTNRAMKDFRNAQIFSALIQTVLNKNIDEPFDSWKGNMPEEPLAWDIERADLYPTIEPDFLKRNGVVTLLSKAEHLLLWAVNSDAKGWYPLYEKRRERQNSFEGCSHLSLSIINKGIDELASKMTLKGYDRYFMLVNMAASRSQVINLKSDTPLELFDLNTGTPLRQFTSACSKEAAYQTTFETQFPAYGYKMIGARISQKIEKEEWQKGYSIHHGNNELKVSDKDLIYRNGGKEFHISLENFQLKALAEMNGGKGDAEWRAAKAYGDPRIFITEKTLFPQMRIDWQIDWLVHLHALMTLKEDGLTIDLDFTFPHPTLIRRNGNEDKGFSFNPEGLDLVVEMGRKCHVGYDIPFGISEYNQPGMNYFCALSSCFMENEDGGILVSPQTGEQAFSVNTDEGKMKVYMGASTTSGPIRNVGLTFKTATNVDHEPAWYAEPFHGTYHHQIILTPYAGKWQDIHLPAKIQKDSEPIYLRECLAKGQGEMTAEKSFIQYEEPNVEITMMDIANGKLKYRINEREGRPTIFKMNVLGRSFKQKVEAFGITGNE